MPQWEDKTVAAVDTLLGEKNFEQVVGVFVAAGLLQAGDSEKLNGPLIATIHRFFGECNSDDATHSFFRARIESTKDNTNELGVAAALSELVGKGNYLGATQEETAAAPRDKFGCSYIRVRNGEARFLSLLTPYRAIRKQTGKPPASMESYTVIVSGRNRPAPSTSAASLTTGRCQNNVEETMKSAGPDRKLLKNPGNRHREVT